MFRTLDLRSVGIAVSEPGPAVETFRRNFQFPLAWKEARTEAASHAVALEIGPAEIRMVAPTAESSNVARFLEQRGTGLYDLVLAVDELSAAVEDLSALGIEVSLGRAPDGGELAIVSPTHTHGVRIVLVTDRQPPGTGPQLPVTP